MLELNCFSQKAFLILVKKQLKWVDVIYQKCYEIQNCRNKLLISLDKLNPAIQNVGSQALNQLSPKIRPKKKYKTNRKDLDGGAIDVHKLIGKLPKPKKGFTLPGHKYTGPYNPLEKQLKYDKNTGEILEIYDRPASQTDAIAMQHDVHYSVCKDDRKCKNKADRKMVKALDNVPYNEKQWGHWLARNLINTRQKLGLGVKPKNVKSRRVKRTGKKN